MKTGRGRKKQQASDSTKDDTEELPVIRSDDRWDFIEDCLSEIKQSERLAEHNRAVMRKKKAESERHFRERLRKHKYRR